MDVGSIEQELQKVLAEYKKDTNSVKDYFASMKEISLWLKAQEEK